MPRNVYVHTRIDADMDRLWAHSQTPELHERWDLRFTEIRPEAAGDSRLQSPTGRRFRYATRVFPGLMVGGTGVHAGERHRPDGSCTSALRFGSDERLSLIRDGSGYWRYRDTGDAIEFITGYDYTVRWGFLGRAIDRAAFRPVMAWATAWSFDRLRIWLEHGIAPARSRNQAVAELLLRLAAVVVAGLAAASVESRAIAPAVLGCAVIAVLIPPAPRTPSARRCLRRPPRPVRPPRIGAQLPARTTQETPR